MGKNETKPQNKTADDTRMAAPPTETRLAEYDFGEDAGGGFENITNADMILPLLIVVQDKSKIVKNDLAKPGQIFLTSTSKAYSEIEIVPAITDHCYLEWTPRDNGGGFKGRHALDSDVVRDTLSVAKSKVGKHQTMRRTAEGKLAPTGTELVEAFEIWCAIGDGNGVPDGFALISCTSMKIKPYRQWITKLRHFQIPKPNNAGKQDVPFFANRTRFVAREEKNAKGEFFNPWFEPWIKSTDAKTNDLIVSMLTPKSQLYQAGKELRQLVMDKRVSADYTSAEQDEDVPPGANEGAAAF